MTKCINAIAVCIVVALLTVSCGSTTKTVTSVPAKENKLANSLLWEISDNGLEKPSYLYGTIHMTCNYVLTEKMKKAFEDTHQLALEIDMDDPGMQGKMMQSMLMKDGKTLQDLISEEDYTTLATFFKEQVGMNLELFSKMKPFAVSSTLLSKMVPCTPPSAYEIEFMKIAKTQNEEVKGLETIEYQMGVFDSIPYKDQLDDLVKMAKEGMEASKNEFQKLTSLYEKEDIEGLLKLMTDSDDMTGKFAEELLDIRNKNWIPVIEQMAKEKATFFGVGAMHLPGENGVIKLLRKAGFKVEPVL